MIAGKAGATKASIDPRTKLTMLGVLLVSAFLFDSYWIQLTLATFVMLLSLLGIARRAFPAGPLITGIKTLMGMLIMVVVLQGFLHPGSVVLFQSKVFGLLVQFKLDGVLFGLGVAIRFISISLAFMIFVLTTTPYDLSIALFKLGIPFKYAYLVPMALDRLPKTVQVMHDIESAQGARGFDLERGGILQRVRNIFPILVPLVILSLRQADMMTVALELRGFGGSTRPRFVNDHLLARLDILLLGASSGLFLVVIVVKALSILLNP